MTTTNQLQAKKPLLELIKTIFIGGFAVILPAYLGILVVHEMIEGLIVLIPAFLEPIASLLGISESKLATPIALIIFVLICFMAGLIVQSSYALFFRNALEPFFKKIPGYLLIRRLTNHMIRMEQVENYDVAFVALAETHQALAPAFLIEQHDNGSYTIFVPIVPTPTVGNIFIIPGDRVFPVNIPLLDMVKFISHWGESSPELLQAIQKIKQTKLKSKLRVENSEL